MSRLLRGGTLGVAVAAQAAMASICNIAAGGNSSADWGGGVYRSDKVAKLLFKKCSVDGVVWGA